MGVLISRSHAVFFYMIFVFVSGFVTIFTFSLALDQLIFCSDSIKWDGDI